MQLLEFVFDFGIKKNILWLNTAPLQKMFWIQSEQKTVIPYSVTKFRRKLLR